MNIHAPLSATLFATLSLAGLACGNKGSSTGSGGATSTGSGSGGTGAAHEPESVLQRNKHATRDGLYVQPGLTRAAAAKMTLDASFHPVIQGNVYAQPLYLEQGPGGKGVFIVVTESNNIPAVAEADGAAVWTRTLGTPAGSTGTICGNITPLGITGTPYIDLPSRTIYLDAVIGDATTIKKHEIHALSLDDGTEKPGFPFDTAGVSYGGTTFDPVAQNQRGALIMVGGTVYVPYGGHNGDCAEYRGWVIGVPVAKPAAAQGWCTPIRGGGMWAPGGLASDGTSVFAATGNTFGASAWSQGEAILRFAPGPVFSGQPADYFTPSDWQTLDVNDIDLGGSGPLLIDVPGATPSALVVALGKNGVAYLLDRKALGGVGTGDGKKGEGVASLRVASDELINAAASYRTAKGTYVVTHIHGSGFGLNCPDSAVGDLVAIKIGAGSPPTLSVAWCAANQGQGSPIATTTDGKSDAIVWTVGAEGSNHLHGFDGDTGAIVFAGGGASDAVAKVRRFTSPIAVNGRIVTAGDNALYAFKAP